MDHAINIRRPPEVRHAAQDGIGFELLVDYSARAFLAVIAVMIDPRFAEHLLTEAAGPFLAVPVVPRVRALLVLE